MLKQTHITTRTESLNKALGHSDVRVREMADQAYDDLHKSARLLQEAYALLNDAHGSKATITKVKALKEHIAKYLEFGVTL